jgi:aminoglycoside phosphotransferase (APT) family kinase protein
VTGRDEPESLARALAGWLRPKLPRAEGLAVTAIPRSVATGFSSDTLLFDLAWREAGTARTRGVVVRRAPLGHQVFPEYDVARQFRILRILAGTKVPVPPAPWLEEDPGVLGAPFYVMERIDGRIPTDNPPYHVGGWTTEIAPAEREALWWSGIDALCAIHGLDWRALGLGFVDTPGAGDTPLGRQLDDYAGFLGWAARGRPQPTCEPALAWLRENRPKEPEPVGFCWGDARPGNMIFRDGRCVAVLDWEMATLGNPVQDLAWWLFLDRHHSEGLGAPRLPGFPGRSETIEAWERSTGLSARDLDYYEVFAAFRFSVIMIRVAQGFVVGGVIPADAKLETDNIPTRLLAKLLGLPSPG